MICQMENLEVRPEGAVCKLKETGGPKTKSSGHWARLGKGDITIDSAADESCWPRDCGGAFEVRPSEKKLRLRAANGAEMQHDGEKDVTFRPDDSTGVLGLTFQVTEVKKALAAVWRLAEHGNIIQFGPRADQNFIMNLSTQQKIPLHKKGGSYVMQVEFMKWIADEPTPHEANQVFQGQAQ